VQDRVIWRNLPLQNVHQDLGIPFWRLSWRDLGEWMRWKAKVGWRDGEVVYLDVTRRWVLDQAPAVC